MASRSDMFTRSDMIIETGGIPILNQQSKVTALPALVLIGFLWGMNWPAVKLMLTEIPPVTIRAVAFPLAAILLAIIARWQGQSLLPAARDRLAIVVTGSLVIFGFNLLATFGQVLTETSNAAIIAYTMPAFTALFATIFLKEKLNRWRAIALVLGTLALAVLASEDFARLISRPAGPIVMLLAAISWALGNVLLKSRQWSISSLALTVWFFGVSSVLCWPLVFFFEPPWEQTLPSNPVLLTLVYHVLGPMVVCYTLWTVLVARLPATVAAISVLTAPVVGVLSAVVLLGEPLTWQKIVSLSMIVLSIMLTLRTADRVKDRATS